MQRVQLRTGPLPIVTAAVLIAITFVIDLEAPPGLAISVLYVAPVAILAMWSPPGHRSLLVGAAAFCSVLILLSIFNRLDAVPWFGAINRALAIGAIWSTVLVSLLRKRTEQKHDWTGLLHHR